MVGYDGAQYVSQEERRVDQQQQSRWRKRGLWTGGIIVTLVVLVVLIRLGYAYHWTGFGQSKVNGEVQPSKTLWDWLSLLIVPGVLALGGYLFARSENLRAQEIADQQRSLDREIADQRRQDDMLQSYLDGMAQLLTDKDRPLHRARPGDSLSTVARARTLTVLTKLDSGRKGVLLRFLYEAGLLDKDTPVFDIGRADLTGVDLSAAALSDATMPPPLFSPGSPPPMGL